MMKCDREAIRRNFVLLTREIPCEEILAHLFQAEIFSTSHVEEILEQPPSCRNFTLLLNLQRRGPKAFQIFVDALHKVKRHDIVSALYHLELSLSNLSL